MDILDQEADEDESFRNSYPLAARLRSHEANHELIEKAEKYRAILQQAGDSDELVRQKWEEWEDNIAQLTWPEVSWVLRYTCNAVDDAHTLEQAELEASIPSSTVPYNQRAEATSADPTRMHARAIRALLENLDDMIRSRADLVARANRLAASEDITPRILKAASGMEQWVNVQPAMFEDILDQELSKYDKFRVQLEEDEVKQQDLLKAVQVLMLRLSWTKLPSNS